MAKHLYSPQLSSIWTGIEQFLDMETPNLPAAIPSMIAMLQARDHDLEGSLLGDLVVDSVAGSLGSSPPSGQQIGWLANFGVVPGGTADGDGHFAITYNSPFPTDTAVALFFSNVPTVLNFFGFSWSILDGGSSRTGFTLLGAAGDPVQGCYLAVGF